MRFISIPFRNLVRRPLSSALTALGISVAIGGLIALVGMSRGMERSWETSLHDRGTHILAVKKGAVEILTASLDENLVNDLIKIPGVIAVSGELVDLLGLENGETTVVTGWGPNDRMWATLKISSGRLPAHNELDSVVLGKTTAQAVKAEPGSRIRLFDQDFSVVGITQQAGAMNNSAVFMPLVSLQGMVERKGRVNSFHIQIAHPDDKKASDEVKALLAKAFPELTFSETEEVADRNHVMQMLRATAWSTSVVAVIVALVVILNTMLMSVMEQTQQIGIMSAIGWQPSRILFLIVLEGLVLAAVGALIGTGLGIGGLHLLAAMPKGRGFIQPGVDIRVIVEAVVAALLLGGLGSLYPAWRAVRINTIEALRHQ